MLLSMSGKMVADDRFNQTSLMGKQTKSIEQAYRLARNVTPRSALIPTKLSKPRQSAGFASLLARG